MAVQYWLVKSEPNTYSWDDFVREGRACWDGVRNFEARKHLRNMKPGDLCLFYHSNIGKAVVGVGRVIKSAYPDPTAASGDWSAVDLEPVKALAEPVTLAQMKGDSAFEELLLIRRSRLSVMPVSAQHFRRILSLGRTKL